MNISSTAALAVYLGFAIACALGADAIAQEPATTTYGDQNPSAPDELDLFSFLVGKWNGTGRTLEDGSYVEWEGATWIGRYVLDGMAIADEFHRTAPDGTPYLGISLRHFDTKQDSWIIEYLNVSDSILHTQVNPQSGSVSQDAGTSLQAVYVEEP